MRKMKKFATSALLIGIMCGMAACGKDDGEKEVTTEYITTTETDTSVEDITTEADDDTTDADSTEKDEKDTEEASGNAGGGSPIETEYAFSSNDWKSLEFALDGVVYTFPMTSADIEAAGFMFDEEDMNETLESNYYTLSYTAENAQGESFYVRFKNFTDTDKQMKDCDIYGVEFENLDYRDINPDVTLCNGVTFGMTVDEVKTIMGEPDYYYESDGDYDRKAMEYYVTGKSYDSSVEFSFTDGILDNITLVNTD